MSAADGVSQSPKESIDGMTFCRFAVLPLQDQLATLAQWSERAAHFMEAGTAPIRWKGQALALKVAQWARAAGLQL